MTEVKICGITRIEDARLAVELGAVAIGINFYKGSKRYVEPAEARRIVETVTGEVEVVGIFVDEDPERMQEIVELTGIDCVQLHGSESVEVCELFGPRTIKALHLESDEDLKLVRKYKNSARILVDSRQGVELGGSGMEGDWDLAWEAQEVIAPIILAGGLDANNIGGAIECVGPTMVDVCSLIELKPGIKSRRKMIELFRKLR